MPAFICETCRSPFTPAKAPPPACPICGDERQYVRGGGQTWTTLDELARAHFNCYQQHEPGLIGVGTVPEFAIGQRALILHAPGGNILWDCISFIDAETIELVKGLGGLSAIAISHPHYYASMVEWSRAFGGIPIYLDEADRQWVQYQDSAIVFWRGETHRLNDDLTPIPVGRHSPASQCLHCPSAAIVTLTLHTA